MSILISNISDVQDSKGLQQYVVSLNDIHLAYFEHVREDGMIVCIQKAAKALEGVNIDAKIRQHQIRRLLEEYKSTLERLADK